MLRLYGFVLWYFTSHLFAKLSNFIIEEAYLGTISQVLTSKAPLWAFFSGLIIVEVGFSSLWVLAFILLAWTIIPLGDILQLAFSQSGKLISLGLIALIGMSGMGLFLLGFSLRFKQVNALSEVILFYMLFFSGFFFDIDRLPDGIKWANFISPLYWASQGVTLSSNTFLGAFVSSAIWLITGILIMRYFWKQAMQLGKLTTYA